MYLLFLLTLFISIYSEVSIVLNDRQIADLELIANGGFAPLNGFLNKEDYESVLGNMRLANGTLWPMPIMLDVDAATAQKVKEEGSLTLLDTKNLPIAELKAEDVWAPDKMVEAQAVFGTTDNLHPGVKLLEDAKEYYVGGPIKIINSIEHADFKAIRRTPAQLKEYFYKNGIDKVVAFQTRNPMHRAHKEIAERAAKSVGAHLLLHPVVGPTKPGDIDYITRIQCYEKVMPHFEVDATLSLLPLAMRMGGPREALWHAIIRKNHGCTHFIVGRDHAGPGKDKNGKDFYGPYDAQELVKKHAKEVGIEVLDFKAVVYVKNEGCYKEISEVSPTDEVLSISGTELRNRLKEGLDIPEWFTYPEVASLLMSLERNRGKVLFFTGLSGSGKSTIAKSLAHEITNKTKKPVSIIDGDEIRNYISPDLGFSKEARALNVKRVGYIASEIAKHGGIVICCMIAPYKSERHYNRQLISNNGQYVEVFVSTPLSTCEERDVKGLYQKARQGIITSFTGISDPYEEPTNAEINLDTTGRTVESCVDDVLGFIGL